MTVDTRPDRVTTTPRRLLTVRDLGAYLQCGSTSARALVGRAGPLYPYVVRVGRLIRIPQDKVDEWIDGGGARWIERDR
jgi:hypothetical protein